MADTWANREADGRTESWVTERKWEWKNIKSVMVWWSCKGSGCVVVIKMVDTEVWLTKIKIALPLGKRSAMLAEIKGCELLLLTLNQIVTDGTLGWPMR